MIEYFPDYIAFFAVNVCVCGRTEKRESGFFLIVHNFFFFFTVLIFDWSL